MRQTLKRMLYWDVIVRLLLASSLLQQGWFAMFHSESLAARILESSSSKGDGAHWFGVAMITAAAVIVVDTMINDVMPDNVALRLLRRFHHVVYLTPGALFLGQAFLAAWAIHIGDLADWGVVFVYALRAAVSALIAWRFAVGSFSSRDRRAFNKRGAQRRRASWVLQRAAWR